MNCKYCQCEMKKRMGNQMEVWGNDLNAEWFCPNCKHVWPEFVQVKFNRNNDEIAVIGPCDPTLPIGNQLLSIPE